MWWKKGKMKNASKKSRRNTNNFLKVVFATFFTVKSNAKEPFHLTGSFALLQRYDKSIILFIDKKTVRLIRFNP